MNSKPVVEVKHLWFRYPGGNWVLRGVDLVIEKGEHVLIIGETGSGKTTLVKAVTGVGELVYGGESRGEVLVDGKYLKNLEPEDVFKVIHIIGQNPYLYFTEPIVRDDLLAYALRVHGEIRVAKQAIVKAVEATGIYRLLDRYFFELSGGEAKRVLVTKSIMANPSLIVFDEPLMWLDDEGVKNFVELLHVLRRLGKSVLVIEHRFLPIYRYFDRIMVLKNGVLRDATELVFTRVENSGSQIKAQFTSESSRSGGARKPALRARELHYGYENNHVLKGVNLELSEGDIVLIYGSNGSGKTTLLKLLSGYLKPKKGKVERYVDVVYIPQNIALFYTEETVEKEVKELCKTRKLGEKCVEEGLSRVAQLGLDPSQSPFNLSHGQMVKLAVELGVLSGAGLLLLDEPFSGLTYKGRFLLLEHISRLSASVVVATSSLDAAVSPVWTSMYKLENGVLSELVLDGERVHHDLVYASKLYSEVLDRA
ncbi:MAG: ATP-binding cassette domain-containing protein [Desulfurococcaceae archaeon]